MRSYYDRRGQRHRATRPRRWEPSEGRNSRLVRRFLRERDERRVDRQERRAVVL